MMNFPKIPMRLLFGLIGSLTSLQGHLKLGKSFVVFVLNLTMSHYLLPLYSRNIIFSGTLHGAGEFL